MITFTANRRRAVCASNDRLTTGSVGIPVEFSFDGWDGIVSKIAVFRAGDVSIDVALLEDACTVPPEVLTTPGETLTIGVYGTDGAGTVVIPTVYADAGCIVRGAEPSGVDPTPPTPSLVEQLLAATQAARTAAQAAQDAADDANALAQSVQAAAEAGEFDGEDGASAYEIAVEHGYTGTEAEWLESLHGQDATVDTTLTQAGEAADAKATGDALDAMQETLEDALNIVKCDFTSGKYIPLGQTGNTTSAQPKTYANTAYCFAGCEPGDEFTLTADGWSASTHRMYAFLSEATEGVYTIVEASSLSLTQARELEITAPAGAAWLAVNAKTSTGTAPELTKGRTISQRIDEIVALENDMARIGPDTAAVLGGGPSGLYTNTQITTTGMTTAAEVYAAYDTLLTNSGVSKNLIGYGSDANGEEDTTLPIYEYVIANDLGGSQVTPAPKVLLTSGIHGGEKVAVVGLYNFVQSLFDGTNEIAACIKQAVELRVVPVCNPGGFDASQRYNLHGVDINRNFGHNWGGRTAQGSAPYSEPETQAIKVWLTANADALVHIDCHNHNQIDQGSTTIAYYIATECTMHRTAWSAAYRQLVPYMADTYSVDLTQYTHVYERNAIPGAAAEAHEIVGIDASILETPVGAYNTHARQTTEITGNLLLALLRNYRAPGTGTRSTAETDGQLAAKLDKNQGVANVGKFMIVGSDGYITTVTMAEWQGGSY